MTRALDAFLLLTGSSGFPPVPTIAWRQQSTEAVVQRALALQAEGRHLLLAGDPVAAGEVVAAPSAANLDGIAACLLDVSPDAQAARLARGGDDPRLLAHHIAFADWMRGHAKDPHYMPHVLSTNGWDAMHWGRLGKLDPSNGGWAVHVIDTSELSTDEVAEQVLTWCRRALEDQAPAIRVL